MPITVSITELRKNIASYLDKVSQGTKVLIRDEKKAITIAQITPTSSFNKDSFERSLRKAAGVFSEKNHPEWKTKTDVITWLNKSRLRNQRTF